MAAPQETGQSCANNAAVQCKAQKWYPRPAFDEQACDHELRSLCPATGHLPCAQCANVSATWNTLRAVLFWDAGAWVLLRVALWPLLMQGRTVRGGGVVLGAYAVYYVAGRD